MRRMIAFLVIILYAGFSIAVAQDSEGSAEIQFTEPTEGLGKLVTIDAEDAFLPSILAVLAEESGYNIVTGPGVNKEERVSVHLKDTPIEQAMNLVVRAAGLSYEVVGTSFLVADSKKLREEVGLTSYVVELQYANAEEVQTLLQDFNAKVQIEPTGNKLLVITSPKVISEIQAVVSKVDKPALQIMLEAQLIEVAVEDEEKFGIDWAKLAQLHTTFVEMGPNEYNYPAMVPSASKYLELPDELEFYPVDGFIDAGIMARQPTVFQVTLDWLMKNNRAEVLANSKIATMNNSPAELKVVDVIPYLLSAGGVGGQVQVYREEVGTKLWIKPTVNSDGYITTEVTPEVSNVFATVGTTTQIPWVTRRTSTTTIRVKDGQPIVIAGLLGVNTKITKHKVPFLGDIPFIGSLFRHRSEDVKKTDLIIQITPHIISADNPGTEMPETLQQVQDKYISANSTNSSDGERNTPKLVFLNSEEDSN